MIYKTAVRQYQSGISGRQFLFLESVTVYRAGCYINRKTTCKGGEGLENELLKELYHRYGQEIYRYLYTICRNRSMAEDIMQDVFCKALISLPSSHVNARAWLYMVGRNLLLNEMKKQKRQVYSDNQEERGADANKYVDSISDCDPEEQTLKKEERDMLINALLSLDTRKREILILSYFEHFTLKEAAVIMGISYENVRILSMRAKRELRRIMEVNGYEIS